MLSAEGGGGRIRVITGHDRAGDNIRIKKNALGAQVLGAGVRIGDQHRFAAVTGTAAGIFTGITTGVITAAIASVFLPPGAAVLVIHIGIHGQAQLAAQNLKHDEVAPVAGVYMICEAVAKANLAGFAELEELPIHGKMGDITGRCLGHDLIHFLHIGGVFVFVGPCGGQVADDQHTAAFFSNSFQIAAQMAFVGIGPVAVIGAGQPDDEVILFDEVHGSILLGGHDGAVHTGIADLGAVAGFGKMLEGIGPAVALGVGGERTGVAAVVLAAAGTVGDGITQQNDGLDFTADDFCANVSQRILLGGAADIGFGFGGKSGQIRMNLQQNVECADGGAAFDQQYRECGFAGCGQNLRGQCNGEHITVCAAGGASVGQRVIFAADVVAFAVTHQRGNTGGNGPWNAVGMEHQRECSAAVVLHRINPGRLFFPQQVDGNFVCDGHNSFLLHPKGKTGQMLHVLRQQGKESYKKREQR